MVRSMAKRHRVSDKLSPSAETISFSLSRFLFRAICARALPTASVGYAHNKKMRACMYGDGALFSPVATIFLFAYTREKNYFLHPKNTLIPLLVVEGSTLQLS